MEEDDDDQNLMEEEVMLMMLVMMRMIRMRMRMEMMVMPQVDKSLHIKGQMNFMPDWNVVMFLGSPAIANLEQLQVGLIMKLHLLKCCYRCQSNCNCELHPLLALALLLPMLITCIRPLDSLSATFCILHLVFCILYFVFC